VAREQLEDHNPDAIVLADSFPDGNGIDYLRELQGISNAPIMCLSRNRDDEVPALDAGAYDFLEKPYDFEVLLKRTNLMINWTGARRIEALKRRRDTVDRTDIEKQEFPAEFDPNAPSHVLCTIATQPLP
jgi:DNA-binding response OmpR family regulator